MSKHIPGPWHVTRDGQEVRHLDGGMLCGVETSDMVCMMPNGPRKPTHEPTARLIAAAPELLAAATLALDLLDELERGGAENYPEQRALRAAIAKATLNT